MKYLILCLLIVIGIILSLFWRSVFQAIKTERPAPSPKKRGDADAIDEVLNLIESVKKLFDGDTILQKGETLGILTIIPIDESKRMYARSSNRLMLRLVMYDEADWRIQGIDLAAKLNSPMFTERFHVEKTNNLIYYTTYTNCRFSGEYKSFMRSLYEQVNTNYPGTFKFDGSLIMSRDNYGESVF